ncbi:MAG TPA: sensor histidine kinase KdpD [Methanomicrobiales archaeon]|nr:sensor histidine kinase KdpD [Methanomicrobiales archaeon]
MTFDPDHRPDPDLLLARVKEEERQKHRGRLKIFLGYAAGVGKTYEMLKSAHTRKGEGVDVRIGYVETHGRPETENLLAGLAAFPRRIVGYRGVNLPELDLDAVLAAAPRLVLVDELAHTNAPGSRHPKRYQDVEELLDAGIDVYTTLNIQHLESLNDIVAQITGVAVKETIPDRVIDEAAEIEVVDLPPPELLQRLREGKVYVPELVAGAIERFFREGNLYALRELTLRRAAERIDEQMLAYMQTHAIPGPWAAVESLLVCVGPSPLSERLVRIARRQADRMNARWTALYVETPSHHRLLAKSKEQAWRSLQLAEKLGGATATVFGLSVADTAIDYARRHNITRILIGKTLRPRWQEFIFGSVVDQLIHHSGNIDVYVISSSGEGAPGEPAGLEDLLPVTPPRSYLDSIGLVILMTVAGLLIRSLISPTNLIMLYLLAVVISAYRWGLRPAILTAVLGTLAFDFFFVSPTFSFRVSDTEYLITFAGLITVGTVVSLLVARVRDHAIAAESRDQETGTLYALAQDLATAMDVDSIVQAVSGHIEEIFQWKSVFLLPEGETLGVHAASLGLVLDANEVAVATWAYTHRAVAGYDTDTLPGSRLRYIPVRSSRGVLGVMGVKPADPSGVITPEQARILFAFANQAALALERVNLAKTVAERPGTSSVP